MDKAAIHGHLHMVKYLHSHRSEGCTTAAMDRAPTLELLKFLHENRTEGCTTAAMCTRAAMVDAARRGRLDMVQFLLKHRPDVCDHPDPAFMEAAIQGSNVNAIKYLLFERHISVEPSLVSVARTLEVVQLCHEHAKTGPWSPRVMDFAACRGRLDVVKFVHEHRSEGCTTLAMDQAARFGHFDVVRFLRKNRTEGCTHRAMDAAVERGDTLMVMYPHENRTEGCLSAASCRALNRGDLELFTFLINQYPQRPKYEKVANKASREG